MATRVSLWTTHRRANKTVTVSLKFYEWNEEIKQQNKNLNKKKNSNNISSVDVNQTKRLTRDDAHNSIEPYTSTDLNELFMLGNGMLPLRAQCVYGNSHRRPYAQWALSQYDGQRAAATAAAAAQQWDTLNWANELSKKEKWKYTYWNFDSDSLSHTATDTNMHRFALLFVSRIRAFVMNFIGHVISGIHYRIILLTEDEYSPRKNDSVGECAVLS